MAISIFNAPKRAANEQYSVIYQNTKLNKQHAEYIRSYMSCIHVNTFIKRV